MYELDPQFVSDYISAVGEGFNAFLPLWAVTVGVFLAFAIANMVRFLITRLTRKS